MNKTKYNFDDFVFYKFSMSVNEKKTYSVDEICRTFSPIGENLYPLYCIPVYVVGRVEVFNSGKSIGIRGPGYVASTVNIENDNSSYGIALDEPTVYFCCYSRRKDPVLYQRARVTSTLDLGPFAHDCHYFDFSDINNPRLHKLTSGKQAPESFLNQENIIVRVW